MVYWFQGPTEKEQIDVQGDIAYDIVEFITDTWPDVIYLSLILPSISACIRFYFMLPGLGYLYLTRVRGTCPIRLFCEKLLIFVQNEVSISVPFEVKWRVWGNRGFITFWVAMHIQRVHVLHVCAMIFIFLMALNILILELAKYAFLIFVF